MVYMSTRPCAKKYFMHERFCTSLSRVKNFLCAEKRITVDKSRVAMRGNFFANMKNDRICVFRLSRTNTRVFLMRRLSLLRRPSEYKKTYAEERPKRFRNAPPIST